MSTDWASGSGSRRTLSFRDFHPYRRRIEGLSIAVEGPQVVGRAIVQVRLCVHGCIMLMSERQARAGHAFTIGPLTLSTYRSFFITLQFSLAAGQAGIPVSTSHMG